MDPPAAPLFRGYEKMHEDTQAWELSDGEARALKRTPCVVLEKIHGAKCVTPAGLELRQKLDLVCSQPPPPVLFEPRDSHSHRLSLCFICEEGRIRTAKRHGILPEAEDFFGHKELLRRIQPQLERVRVSVLASLAPERRDLNPQVLIFGEIFGGQYPHPSVAPVDTVQAIQTGVYYCPGIEFGAFDIAVRNADADAHTYVDFDLAIKIFQSTQLFYAAPLAEGTWAECIAYPLPFNSTVPARLGLPPLANNRAEGVVIKSLREMRFPTRQGGFTRAMIKKKIAEFTEDRRFHQAQKWVPPAVPKGGLPPLTVCLIEIDELLEHNRLAAAISKVGPLVARAEGGKVVPQRQHMKEALAMLVADIETELSRRFSAELRALTPAERETLSASLAERAKSLILDFVKKKAADDAEL